MIAESGVLTVNADIKNTFSESNSEKSQGQKHKQDIGKPSIAYECIDTAAGIMCVQKCTEHSLKMKSLHKIE